MTETEAILFYFLPMIILIIVILKRLVAFKEDYHGLDISEFKLVCVCMIIFACIPILNILMVAIAIMYWGLGLIKKLSGKYGKKKL